VTDGVGSEHFGVAERFQIRGLLGSGATASVYEAVDRVTGEDVALKVLHPHLASEPALAHAFLREAITVEALSHPHLCALRARGDGVSPERTWTAWELVRGMSLAESVRTAGRVDPLAATTLVGRLLDALAVLHAAGIVHRDVSPANVLIHRAPDGSISDVRLVDFGLAAPVGESARGGDVLRSTAGDGVVGNAAYASPEQLRGEPIGCAGDVYQVAGLLYFALVGTPPFPRVRTHDVVQAHLTALPPTASVTVPGVPVGLDRVIVRGLLKDPTERFPDAHAMRLAIDAVARTWEPRVRPPVTAAAPALAPRPVVQPTRVLAPGSVPRESEESEQRRTSPWLWVLAGTAAALVLAVVVVVAARPGAAGPAAAPTSSAAAGATPGETPTVTPTPSVAVPTPSPSAATLVPVPDVRGLALSEAVAVLRGQGLVDGQHISEDGTAPAQTVVSSSAQPGAQVAAGSTIDLTVASGWNGVPDVVGYAEQDAIARVSAAGLVPVVVRTQRSGVVGAVASMEPAAATRQGLGSTVTLVVPTAPTPTPTPPASPTATPSPEPTR
jgi:serine/threonine-protein kinase